MIVLSDTSPINYLVQLGRIEILQVLFERVVAPAAVLRELRSPDAPAAVAAWAADPPSWFMPQPPVLLFPNVTEDLDDGEREAIQLALNLRAELILIDERDGVSEAQRLALRTTGTLGVLLLAGKRGLIDVRMEFERLVRETSFRSTAKLRDNFRITLSEHGL